MPIGKSFRIFLALLCVVPVCVPFEVYFGPFGDAVELISTPLRRLGLLVVLGLTVVSTLFPPVWFQHLSARFERLPAKVIFPVLGLVVFGLLFWIAENVMTHHPLFVDEVACLLQAKIFALGHFTLPTPKYPQFFVLQNMVIDENGWYSQYPPGHPLLLVIGLMLGSVYLVPCVLSGLTALIIWRIAYRIYGKNVAVLTAALTALCPFYLVLGASLFNHVPTLFFLALTLLFYIRWEEEKLTRFAILTGFCLGASMLARPVCGLAAAIPLGCWWLKEAYARKAWKDTILAGIFGALPLSFGLVYNAKTTGGAFTLGYTKLWGQAHAMGFHDSPWGHAFNPFLSIGNLLFHFAMVDNRLFEWPLPSLIPLAIYLALWKIPLERWDRRFLAWVLIFPAVYFFYWHRDSIFGPRYVSGALITLLPLMARAILVLAKRFAPPEGQRSPQAAYSALIAGLLFAFAYTIAFGMPERFGLYRNMMPSMRLGLREAAAQQGITKGLIFIPISMGGRVISTLRGAGVPATIVERAYQKLDHCFLLHLSQDLRDKKITVEDGVGQIVTMLNNPPEISKVIGSLDPTLNLRVDIPPDAECVEQVKYDTQGFKILSPFLVESFPPDPNGFVVAADLREQNHLMRELYPNLPAYIYRKGSFIPLDS